jgi:DNA modification methylase
MDCFDAVLTSPPYLNSFDYTDIYRPEMLLLQHAHDSTDLRRFRFNSLRSHVQVAWHASPPLTNTLLQQKVGEVERAGSWSSRIPDMINAYFVDLERVIKQCARNLRKGGIAAFVVSDSAYNGIVIPVGEILAQVLEGSDFHVETITLFRKTRGNSHHQQRSSEHLKEQMVTARYTPA